MLADLSTVVVVNADSMGELYGLDIWRHEKVCYELIGEFIDSLSAK